MKYIIETEQLFLVTYEVEADSPEDAWDKLVDGEAENLDQQPESIIGTFEGSSIEEDA